MSIQPKKCVLCNKNAWHGKLCNKHMFDNMVAEMHRGIPEPTLEAPTDKKRRMAKTTKKEK